MATKQKTLSKKPLTNKRIKEISKDILSRKAPVDTRVRLNEGDHGYWHACSLLHTKVKSILLLIRDLQDNDPVAHKGSFAINLVDAEHALLQLQNETKAAGIDDALMEGLAHIKLAKKQVKAAFEDVQPNPTKKGNQ